MEIVPTGLPDLSKQSRATINLRKTNLCITEQLKETHVDTWETFLITINLLQNLTQGRSRYAEVESEVNNCKILHPEAKLKENHPKNIYL